MKKKNKDIRDVLPPADSSFRRARRLLWLVLPGVLAFGFYKSSFVVTVHLRNGRFLTSSYTMQENEPGEPRLRLLRQREKLDDVVAPGKTEFEKIVLLRHWAHEQWKSGGAFYYPPWDAVEILDLARRYGNYGFCAQYAIVFLQACQAMGLHARYVELPGHFIVGVWSDDYNRWVVMDPLNDLHYLYKGVPTSGGRLCDVYWKKDFADIQKVSEDGSVQPIKPDDLFLYRMYSIVERADQLTNPVKAKVNGGPIYPLQHLSDYHHYPLIGRDQLGLASPYLCWKEGDNDYGDKPQSSDPDDFRYPMNQTLIFIARQDPQQALVKIVFWHENTPAFDYFLANFEQRGWTRTDSREVFLTLRPGYNRLSVRVHTAQGWEGPEASITLFYKPRSSWVVPTELLQAFSY